MEPVTLVITGRSLHHSALMYRGRGRMRNGKWGPAPKSAPPNLARRRAQHALSRAPSSTNMRVRSAAHSSALQPRYDPSQEPSLSMRDVYKMADTTRKRMSQESRQMVLTRTQKLVRNDSGMSRPHSGLTPGFGSRGAWNETLQQDPPTTVKSPRPCYLEGEKENRGDPSGGTEEAGGGAGAGLAPGSTGGASPSRGSSSPSAQMTAKLRVTSAGQLLTYSAGGSSDPGGRSRRSSSKSRLNSALTTVSSALASDLGCVSPRNFGTEAQKMHVSRQCCEVMGPGVCRDCQKLRARLKDRERMEADFPRLRISEKNVTTSAVVMRVLPDMTQAEIQDKIARGEIDRSGLLFPPHRFHRGGKFSDNDDEEEEEGTDFDFKLKHNGIPGHHEDGHDQEEDTAGSKRVSSRSGITTTTTTTTTGRESNPATGKSSNSLVLLAKLKLQLGGEASTPLFFMNLKHMNSKIFQGRVNRSVKVTPREEGEEEEEEEEEIPRGWRKKRLLSVSDNPMCVKAFVSPRKVKPPEEPSYKVYFDPPLLAKHRQESTPSFFAGSDNPYHLPERLPDVIEFADGQTSVTDPAALRSESSMSFVSAVSEEGLIDAGPSQRSEGLKAVQE